MLNHANLRCQTTAKHLFMCYSCFYLYNFDALRIPQKLHLLNVTQLVHDVVAYRRIVSTFEFSSNARNRHNNH